MRAVVSFCLVTAAVGAAAVAGAARYETFVEIEAEEDLYDLLATDEISEDTFETLHDLYQRGVDLNEASREELYTLPNLTYAEVDAILEYREEAEWIEDPTELVIENVLSERKLRAMAPFLMVRESPAEPYETSGWIRMPTRWSPLDEGMPPTSLRARVDTLNHLTLGVGAALTRQRVGNVVYDPNRGALAAEPPSPGLEVPKVYASWETPEHEVVAGTYRIGFGQRLTFDNTNRVTPDGIEPDDQLSRVTELTRECKESAGELEESPCTGEAQFRRVTPDFRWRTGLLGVAGGLKDIDMGEGTLKLHGFASHQPHSIYQYQIYDRDECDDPNECSAPTVYVRDEDDPLAPTAAHSFQTLPNMYAESTLGGNVTYQFGQGRQVGVTGYGSSIRWLVDGMDLDFQDWAPVPYGGPFGAVGVDGAYRLGSLNLFAEVAHSFDSMNTLEEVDEGGGGTGALVRGVQTWGDHELESSLRYYDTDFANPHGRGVSAPTRYDGIRSRDEVGGRLGYNGDLTGDLSLRSDLDLFYQPSEDILQGRIFARTDYELTDRWSLGYWTQYRDRNLAAGGRDECFETQDETDEITGRPIPCGGEQYRNAGRVRVEPHDDYTLTVQLQHQFLDSRRYDEQFRQDIQSWLTFTANPRDNLRLHLRSRYLFDDIHNNESREQSFWNYADITYGLAEGHDIRLRYDLLTYLDDRQSTNLQEPAPEHWVWLELHSRF